MTKSIAFGYETKNAKFLARYSEKSKKIEFFRNGVKTLEMVVDELNLLFGILAVASDETEDIRPEVPDHSLTNS